MTGEQFLHLAAQPLREQAVERDREYVLSFPETCRRYETLAARVRKRRGSAS